MSLRKFKLFLSSSSEPILSLETDSSFYNENSETTVWLKLKCTVSRSEYCAILNYGWLNLDVDNQEYDTQKFDSTLPIQLEISFNTELSPEILRSENKVEAALIQLQILSQNQSQKNEELHPLLQEQNWYCTTISQTQPNGEKITHHTLWHYLLPTLQNPTPDSIADSITHYITDQTTASLEQITQATDPLFQDIAQTFQDLFTGTLTDLETHPKTENASATVESSSLLTPLIDFLESEGWPYAQFPETTAENITLRLAFRGENGQWPCYAKINQTQQTLCFYSISPIIAEPIHYPTVAEYLTRANYGTILGNFELDYTDGEIRYKTSIDVEGATLTPALLQNLIYTNVMMMDQYLPGILAVLEQGINPAQAIALVEQPGEDIPNAS